MHNIWKYKDAGRVRITTIGHETYEGNIISMMSPEDYVDLGNEDIGDIIDIVDKGNIFSFAATEIASIEIIPAAASAIAGAI